MQLLKKLKTLEKLELNDNDGQLSAAGKGFLSSGLLAAAGAAVFGGIGLLTGGLAPLAVFGAIALPTARFFIEAFGEGLMDFLLGMINGGRVEKAHKNKTHDAHFFASLAATGLVAFGAYTLTSSYDANKPSVLVEDFKGACKDAVIKKTPGGKIEMIVLPAGCRQQKP